MLQAHLRAGFVTAPLTYQPHIDGLRALAVAIVVLFHAFPRAFPGGFVGVDVFFVISGFLISRIIMTELAHGTFSLARFYAARARRIFPALALVLAAVLVASAMLLPRNSVVEISRHAAAGALFLANIYSLSKAGYFSATAIEEPLLHLWSLGIEEQFYLVWPVGLMLLWRRTRKLGYAIGLIGAASLALGVIFANYREAAFFLPFTRAWELMLGAWLAWAGTQASATLPARGRNLLVLAGIAMVAIAVFAFDDTLRYPGFYALLPTIGAGFILWAGGGPGGGAARIFNNAPAVGLGKISYPLYLWHWPVLSLFALRFPLREDWTDRLWLCALSILLAWLTYRFIERPIRRRHTQNKPRMILTFSAPLGALTLIALSVAAFTPWTKPEDEIASIARFNFDVDSEYRVGRCHLQPGQLPASFAAECFSAEGGQARQILLWGDSAAAGLSNGLRALAGERYAITDLTASACPPMLGFSPPERPNCEAINRFVMAEIVARKPSVVVMSTLFYANSPGLAKTIAAVKAAGVETVVLIGAPPFWPSRLPQYILTSYDNTRRLQTRLPLTLRARQTMTKWDELASAMAEEAGATYVSPYALLCSAGACLSMLEGEPVAFDEFHLTRAGSAFVSKAIYQALE